MNTSLKATRPHRRHPIKQNQLSPLISNMRTLRIRARHNNERHRIPTTPRILKKQNVAAGELIRSHEGAEVAAGGEGETAVVAVDEAVVDEGAGAVAGAGYADVELAGSPGEEGGGVGEGEEEGGCECEEGFEGVLLGVGW